MAATFPGVCAVVPAAGFGRRMQTECPKQYLSIGNKTILEHAVAALLAGDVDAFPRVTPRGAEQFKANPRFQVIVSEDTLFDFINFVHNPLQSFKY